MFEIPLWSILFELFWFSWSLCDLSDTQWTGKRQMKLESKDKEGLWGFGQVLPMILCILPILAAVQEVLSKWI